MLNYTFSLVDFEILILILVRISCFVYAAPFFGMKNVPSRVKIGLSFLLSILIFPSVDQSAVTYTGMFGYAVIVLREGITGLLMGFAANICNSIILFAGNIIDMDIGLSMAQEFDPMTNSQVTITGNLYQYLLLLMMVVTNMHHYVLRALIDSYQVIPVNGQVFQWDSLAESMINLYGGSLLLIAFRIVSAGICLHDDTKLHPRHYGEGSAADEYVCGRNADEGAPGTYGIVPHGNAASGNFRFCV